MGISRSGYYRWLERKKVKSAREQLKSKLQVLVKNYHQMYLE